MAAIYEEIVLAWKGKNYTVRPSFRMVQRIEAGGISIVGVCAKMQRGEVPTSQVAEIIAHMLTSGGAKGAIPERVYEHLAAHADADEWSWIYNALLTAFIPKDPNPGNSEAPEQGAETDETQEKKRPT